MYSRGGVGARGEGAGVDAVAQVRRQASRAPLQAPAPEEEVRARGSGELLPPNPCPQRTAAERPSPPGRVVEVLGYSFE